MTSYSATAIAGCLCAGHRLATGQQSGSEEGPLVQSVALDLTINPASAAWVDQALQDAEDAGADLVILRLDTPGGLDDSTRDIVKDILAAPMPVVVYVSPDGARAASAGLFITQAADAAMAPETNIGRRSARRRRAGRGC
jgi:membrane-bound serine protease (ClpP class)